MDDTYGEFQGTELDPSLDFDFDDDEENDLLPILGMAAAFAAVVGAALVIMGRRREPTATERVQEALAAAGKEGSKTLKAARKEGSKTLKAASKAATNGTVAGLLGEAIDKAHSLSSDIDVKGGARWVEKRAGDLADSGTLRDLLDEARLKVRDAGKYARNAADDFDAGDKASKVAKRASSVAAGVGLADLLHSALEQVTDASKKAHLSDLGDNAADAGKRASKAVESAVSNVDTEGAGKLLDDLKEKLVEAIDSLRNDVAPKAASTFRETVVPTAQEAARKVQDDVFPAAQDAVSKLREDVLPGAQKRAEHFAQEHGLDDQAKKAARAAGKGASNFSDMMRSLGMAVAMKVVDDLLPGAKDFGAKAVHTAREDVIPAAADTAGHAAQHVRDDVLPRVGEAASQAPGMLSDLLEMAREKVGDAIDKAQPVVSDAATAAAQAAGTGARGVADAAKGSAHGVGGAMTSARRGVGGAVGNAVDATTYVTKETTGVLFWLAALGALILLVFVPEKDKQEELWGNIRQFLGEVREMWRDLQSPEYELDAGSETDLTTG